MSKIISIVLLLIFSFNNFANATLWPSAEETYYWKYKRYNSNEQMEILNYCKDKNYQTSMGYYNCLNSFNYLIKDKT